MHANEVNKTRVLVECALFVALATVLSLFTLFSMPQGGTITPFSMVPLLLASHRHGIKWGAFTGFTHGLLQTLLGLKNVMYCTTIWAMAGCVLLDYIIAYTVIGLASAAEPFFKNQRLGIMAGAAAAGLLRYLCSFLSGILIWGGYAPEGTPVWLYSLVYNGSYMIPEILLTAGAAVILLPLLDRLGRSEKSAS